MKIAVFGTGVVGQTLAEKLSSLGHQVKIGTRDIGETMARSNPDNYGRPPFKVWQAEHTAVTLGTFKEAAAFGELIVNALNGSGTIPALEQAGKANLTGKVMIDISNPLDFSKGFPPSLFVSNTDSLAEQIQRAFPELKVVKSLNTLNASLMVNPALLSEDHTVFMNGNDSGAKAKVKEILQSFGWKEHNIIDLGNITTARGTEQLLPIWVRLYGALQTPMFNFKIVMNSTSQA